LIIVFPRQKTIEAWSVLLMVVGLSGRRRAGQAGFGMRILLNVVGGLAVLAGSFFGTLFILDHLPLDPVAREVKTLRTALQRYRLDRLSYPVLNDVPISDIKTQLVSSGHLSQSPDADKEARYVSLDGKSYGLLFHINRTPANPSGTRCLIEVEAKNTSWWSQPPACPF
jgi:hypothetical protein